MRPLYNSQYPQIAYTMKIVGKFFLILLFTYTDTVIGMEYSPVTIKTVDKTQTPFPAETLIWWYSDTPDTKHYLSCQQQDCTEWTINKQPLKAIGIHALSSRTRNEDPECSDIFEAKAEIPATKRLLTLILQQTATVCK